MVAGFIAEALLMLWVYRGAPDWWMDLHPDELQVYADGSTARELQQAGRRMVPSLASPTWQADCERAMREFMRWLVWSDWFKRVGGALVTYGITWEWSILGTDGLPDYSLHARRYFRSYLRRIYPDAAALSQS